MVELLRYQLFLSAGAIFLGIWRQALSHVDSIKSWTASSNINNILQPSMVEILIKYLPFWAIIALGLYALSTVLYRVATFGDCPEAAEELSSQIGEAKEKLKAAGFTF